MAGGRPRLTPGVLGSRGVSQVPARTGDKDRGELSRSVGGGAYRVQGGLSPEFVPGGTWGTHCSSPKLARGARWHGRAGDCGDLLASASRVACAGLVGKRERKSSYDSGDGALLLVLRACCCLPLGCLNKFPGKPLSEMWRFEGTDLGALCQVLFVPGITSPDYCLTTSPSLSESHFSSPSAGLLLGLPCLGTAWSMFCVCVGGAL